MESTGNQTRSGYGYALGAYVAWGLFPLYWKMLRHFPAQEILAHRVLWSTVFFGGMLWIRSQGDFRSELLKAAKHLRPLLFSAVLIGGNWFLYIWAVNSGHVLEASLGYFINPLVNIVLGMVFLNERLNRLQWFCVGLATGGVLQLAIRGDGFPYVSLILAISFGIYGLIRKRVPVSAVTASTWEGIVLAPLALAYVIWLPGHPEHQSLRDAGLLVLGGIVTGLPLLWFVEAARRLPLSTMGFFQYLSPSLQFALAVFAFGEEFTRVHARAFGLIWLALALFSFDLGRRTWQSHRATRTSPTSEEQPPRTGTS